MGLATHATDTVGVAKRLFELFAAEGLDGIGSLLHPDVKASPRVAGGAELTGRAEVLEWWEQIARSGVELEARPLDFELQGDCVIVRGYLRHRDGRTLAENQVFWLYEVHDGQITRMESHPSRKAALAAVGVSS